MAVSINMGLSNAAIRAATTRLNDYANGLQAKAEEFVLALAREGLGVANAKLAEATREMVEHPLFSSEAILDSLGGVAGAVLKVSGSRILFVEFSAGITYGSKFPQAMPSGHQYGQGMGMGTYPGLGYWDQPQGWWYYDPDSAEANQYGYVHTYGNRAYKPMYHAEAAIISRVSAVARTVFGGQGA